MNCVTSVKPLHFSEPQFCHLLKWIWIRSLLILLALNLYNPWWIVNNHIHCVTKLKEIKCQPGMVAHTCNSSTLGGSLEVRSSRPAWPIWWNPISNNNMKISLVCWCMTIVPGTWEAEAGELLDPGRQRLQWVKITPLHSSLGGRVRFHLKKKKKDGL